ncbi:MAG: slt [Rickettsiaceae bacterium]|nr:slt [Rickettsiaceae bacterium]
MISCFPFFINNSFSADAPKKQMSQRLWGGLKKEDVENLKELSLAIDVDDYKKAAEIAKKMQGQSNFSDAVLDIALWNKYRQVGSKTVSVRDVEFEDISKFVSNNRFFPNISGLEKNVEKVALANNIPYEASKEYFEKFPALSLDSKLYLLKSEIDDLASTKDSSQKKELQKNIQDLVVDIWVNENLSANSEQKFFAEHASKLTEENHIARIERLLWDNKSEEAKRIFYLVNDSDYKTLFYAIIDLSKKNPQQVDKIIASVPKNLRGNELLAYKLVMYKKSQIGKDTTVDDLVKILLTIPANVNNPDKWWPLRKLYGREMIKTKEYKDAYNIISNHGLEPKDTDFSDAEWTAGWIALRFLDKPKIAYNHFNNLYLNVSYPVSISRAAYWLGMAALEMGDKKNAIDWYKVAAKYPTYFYGQLAIHKRRTLDTSGSQEDTILPKDPTISGADVISVSKENSVKVAYILALIGDRKSAAKIFEYGVANAETDGEIAVIMKVVNEIGNKELDVKISKAAAKRNVFFIKDKFQIIKEIENDSHAPLVHAIIKQESGFAPTALSPVGAIGFMQLMPETASLVCKKIGIKYNRNKLATDVSYNIVLGSYYIKSLIDDFNGSELLAIASYNAGPGATKRWIKEFYDPRQEKNIDKVVDWVELITYSETRNYVQRIMENLIVYKYLMSRMNYDDIK